MRGTNRGRRGEQGVALLISIFVLLLISIVAIALVVSSGTESALAGNYRSSTGVYYAALSGLEEARGRLLARNPDSFASTAPGFLPAPGTTLPIGSVAYVLNPGPTETAPNILTAYPDTEYDSEFGNGSLAGATVTTTNSVWNKNPLQTLNLPGPLYKWARINAVSEKSLNLDVDADGLADSIAPLYFDGAHFSNNSFVGPQVLEITSYASLPNLSQKLVQYLAVPTPVQLPPLAAALTLAGSVGGVSATVAYSSPNSNTLFKVMGIDQDCNGNPTGNRVPAIGVLNSTDVVSVISGGNGGAGIKPNGIASTNYQGYASSPDVETVNASFSSSMLTPAGLDAAVQSISQNADVVITPTASGSPPYLGTATGANLTPLGMGPNNLLTVVVNGNLDISNWSNDGYGLVLVTGTFTYDPDTNWNGIVLVIGQGIVNNVQHGQYKEINGAMFVSQTRDHSTNQLLPGPNLGGASVIFDPPMQGNGIRYSSCWIQKALPKASYKILSFHEIPQ